MKDAFAKVAEQQVRDLAKPQTPDDFKVELPASFKPPGDVTFAFDMNDPALKQAREIAHARGLDQSAFSDLLAVYAGQKISEVQTVTNARNAEIAKLGSAATARVDAITQWLSAKFGDRARVMADTIGKYPVAANIELLEDVIKLVSSQGGGSFTQSGREGAAEQGKIPGYEGMTFEQRRAAQMNLENAKRAASGR